MAGAAEQLYLEDLGQHVWLVDLMEQDRRGRSASYLILDDHVTVVDTGSAKSHQILLQALDQLNVPLSELAYIIVTHVHLDHAGGAGQLMAKAPNAKLVVHPRGARHMMDPSRLWAGAGAVYGDKLQDLFGSVMPVPEERVLVREDGDTLRIGHRTLTFYDAPGHAKHHFTIMDEALDALYAGDALGIRYRTCFTGWNFEWILPSTSPVDFDPDAVERTVTRMQALPVNWVYHTHFGRSPKQEACMETLRGARAFADLIERFEVDDMTPENVIAKLRAWICDDLRRQGHEPGPDIEVLDIDVVLDALGLIHYRTHAKR